VSKRILLIDSDEAFAQGLSTAIQARGFSATLATDSERGIALAKQENPDLIVVCVEAQPTNGYMLCTRLKKDEQLKGIPVILTSANASPDAFEKHKKLKTRAEEYLTKPFTPTVMLERASSLMGIAAADGDDDIIHVEDEPLGLGDLVDGEDEPISLSDAEAAEARSGQPEEALEVEEVEEVVQVREDGAAEGDDDMDMFDKAFDSLGTSPQPPPAATTRFNDLPTHSEDKQPTELSAPDDDAVLHSLVHGEEPVAVNDPDLPVALDQDLSLDQDLPVSMDPDVEPDPGADLDARLADLETRLAERDAELDHARKGAASNTEVIRIKESKNKAEKEILRLKEELHAKDKELVDLQETQTALESQAQQLKDEAVKREAAARTLQQRAEALAAAAKKFERELTAARDDAKKGAGAEQLRGRVAGLEKELESARTDVAALTGEKDLLSEEREDLRRQLEDAQASAARNEERAIKAYSRIKNEEKLREKAKKALQIALQLLEENPAESDDPEEAAIKSA